MWLSLGKRVAAVVVFGLGTVAAQDAEPSRTITLICWTADGFRSINGAKAGLQDPSPEVRGEVVRLLADRGFGDASGYTGLKLEQVQESLRDDRELVRRAAAKVLGRMGEGNGGLASKVVALLESGDPEIRQIAVQSLGRMGRDLPFFRRELTALGQHSDPLVRLAAAEAFALLGEPAPAAALLQEWGAVQQAAVRALARLGPAAAAQAGAVADLWRAEPVSTNVWLLEHLAAFGPVDPTLWPSVLIVLPQAGVVPGVARQLAKLSQAFPALRRELVSLASQAGPDRADALLVLREVEGAVTPGMLRLVAAQLAPGEAKDRIEALEVLGRFGTQAAEFVPAIRTMLAERNPAVQEAVVAALGELGPASTVAADEVMALWQERPSFPLGRALGRLGRFDPAPARKMRELLKDPSRSLAYLAVGALGEMGPNAVEALPELAALLNDPHLAVPALEALGKLGPVAAPVAANVAALLRGGQPWLRQLAAETLGKMGLAAADAAAPDLSYCLTFSDEHTTVAALQALGKLGDEAILYASRMAAFLTDPRPSLRFAAEQALRPMSLGPIFGRSQLKLLSGRGVVTSEALQVLDRLLWQVPDEDLGEIAELGHRWFEKAQPADQARLRAHLYLWLGL